MSWESIYDKEELEERYAVVVEQTQLAFTAQGRVVDVDKFLAEGESWLYALEKVPTHQLRECFRRAIQGHASEFPLVAGEVLKEWESLKGELMYSMAQAQTKEQLSLPGPKKPERHISELLRERAEQGRPILKGIGRWPTDRPTEPPRAPQRAEEEESDGWEPF